MRHRRDTNGKPLKEVIDSWLSEHPNAGRAQETRVIHLWGALLGPAVNNRTRSIRLKNGKLTVRLESAVLRNELNFAKANIVECINKELGDNIVTELVLT